MVFSTLKLFQVLRSLLGGNDDLDDAWAEAKKELYARLINLLLKSGRKQPVVGLFLTANLLSRSG
jgi:hypothetical protein